MKYALALALALLSTLAVASHGIVHQRRHNLDIRDTNDARACSKKGSHTHKHEHSHKGSSTGSTPSSTTSPSTIPGTSPSMSLSTSSSTSSSISPSTSPATELSTTWGQNPQGIASFTQYTGCGAPSCGITTTGFTAAINTYAFGAWSGAGDVCGRCFKITPTSDPYSPQNKGPFGNTIVVRATDLCPHSSGGTVGWCDQSVSQPKNGYNATMHFDLCKDSGAADAFFDANLGALVGNYEEVSCTEWRGNKGNSLWGQSCLADVGAPLWPATSCGNKGSPPV